MFDLQGLTAGILVRISDDREGRALGVKRQEEDCRYLAARLGLDVVNVYIENDVSATPIAGGERQDFDDFMSDWQSGSFKVPLAYTTSRLTRDNVVAERIIAAAQLSGISPQYVASPSCDLMTAAGRRMYRSLAVNDTGEAEDIQERVRKHKQQEARLGKWKGGRRLYGYGTIVGVDPKNGKEIRDPYQQIGDEVAVLEEGKQRTLAGESQFSILRDWKERGVKTSLGFDWAVGRFKRTLLNESYVIFDSSGHPSDCPCLHNPDTGGTRIHHEDRHRALWPGLFTRAEHEALKAVFNGTERYKNWAKARPGPGRRYLLTGIIECGGVWADTDQLGQLCGGYMYGQGKKDARAAQPTYQRRYACRKWAHDGTREGCGRVFRIAEPVERLVTEAVLMRFDSPEVAKALAPPDDEKQMASVIQQLAELHTRRERLAGEYALGEVDKPDYQAMLSALKNKIQIAESEKERLLSAQVKSLAVPTDGSLRELWDSASLEWRSSVIKLIVEKVVILPGRPGGKANWNGWKFDPDLVQIVWLH